MNKDKIKERLKAAINDDSVLDKVAETMLSLGIFDDQVKKPVDEITYNDIMIPLNYIITGTMNVERARTLVPENIRDARNFNAFYTYKEAESYSAFINAMNKLRIIRNYIEGKDTRKDKCYMYDIVCMKDTEDIIGGGHTTDFYEISAEFLTNPGLHRNSGTIMFSSIDNVNLAINLMGIDYLENYFGIPHDAAVKINGVYIVKE